MKIIAHRGANREAPENSFSAFEKAIDGGATRLEFDVHLTADSEVVIIHDENMLRTTGIDKKVTVLKRAELEPIQLSNGEKIPFLDELCQRLLDKVEFNIEIKSADLALAKKVYEIIKKFKSYDKRVVISSFLPEPIEFFSTKHSEIPVACLFYEKFLWPKQANAEPLITMQRTKTKIIHPCENIIDESFMHAAKKQGWAVYTYSEFNGEEKDREKTWNKLLTLGVDGHCTNYPREFFAWLKKAKKDGK